MELIYFYKNMNLMSTFWKMVSNKERKGGGIKNQYEKSKQ